MDRGDLSLKGVKQKLQQEHTLSSLEKNEITTLVTHFVDHLILNSDMKELFLSLSKSYNIYILSNFQSKPFQRLLSNHDFLNQAKGIVVSADIMMKKPEIGIYHFLLSQYRLLPHECIFIDDLSENIKTAKKLLINPILFKSFQQTTQKLKQYNIAI